jgi:hypothetical protein
MPTIPGALLDSRAVGTLLCPGDTGLSKAYLSRRSLGEGGRSRRSLHCQRLPPTALTTSVFDKHSSA